MIPDFSGQTILRVEVSNLVRVYTHEGWQIDLEGDVYLTAPEMGTRAVPTDGSVEQVPDELQAWADGEIAEVVVSPEGHLAITVSTTQLSARASDMYEAWQMYGPKGEMIVCGPGGELDEWGSTQVRVQRHGGVERTRLRGEPRRLDQGAAQRILLGGEGSRRWPTALHPSPPPADAPAPPVMAHRRLPRLAQAVTALKPRRSRALAAE